MTKPQQPELRRSGRGETDDSSAQARVTGPLDDEGRTGPVPEENRPGHHPPHDQDQPETEAVGEDGAEPPD